MQMLRVAFLAGAAAVGLCGLAAMAEAGSPQTHVLTLRLPDGRIEQVRYVGDVAPTVILAPDTGAPAAEVVDPFAMLERISAEMDQQAEALFQTINALAGPNGADLGSIQSPPAPGVCVQSVQITYTGDGHAPHVVANRSGDCGSDRGAASPAQVPAAPAMKPAPRVIEAKAAVPYANLVHPVSDRGVSQR